MFEKKEFVNPEMELVSFDENEDIIVSSGAEEGEVNVENPTHSIWGWY